MVIGNSKLSTLIITGLKYLLFLVIRNPLNSKYTNKAALCPLRGFPPDGEFGNITELATL
jgi:hypothetical protein